MQNKYVLYNGRDERFSIYDEQTRNSLRSHYGAMGKSVVAFAGNFREVKNVLVIPEIYRLINKSFPNVVFWMLGDGKLRSKVEKLSGGLNVVFWGNQEPEVMPDFMNCVDILILPSINEGLPLTLVEALASGARCVGSRVGGISEVIGIENTFELNSPTFVSDFANRVVTLLKEPSIKQPLSPVFSWSETGKKETKIIKELL